MYFLLGKDKKARGNYYKFIMVYDDENKKAHYNIKYENQFKSERITLATNLM